MNLPKQYGSKYKAEQIQGGPENHDFLADLKLVGGLLRGCAEDGGGESGCGVQEGQRYSDEPFAAERKVKWVLWIVWSVPINEHIGGRRGLLEDESSFGISRIRHSN